MSRLIERVDTAPPLLWLAADDFCAALFAGGHAPWLDTTAWLAWRRKGQGLLKNEVASLSGARVAEAWLSTHAALRAALAAKSRLLSPLRALLADEGLRAHLREMLAGLRASQAGAPLVLELPSPRAWAASAHALAFADQPTPVVDADDADAAAVYVADFVRAFGDIGIDALLLVENASTTPASDDDLSCYGAVFNVAAHYRWACGLRLPAPGAFDAAPLDFVIAPAFQRGARRFGAWLGSSGSDAPIADAAFRYFEVPADLAPEPVLDRLAKLREAT